MFQNVCSRPDRSAGGKFELEDLSGSSDSHDQGVSSPKEIFFRTKKGSSIPADCWWVSHNAKIFLLVFQPLEHLEQKNQIKYVRCFCNLPPPNFPGWIRLESSARGHHLTPHCPLNFCSVPRQKCPCKHTTQEERGGPLTGTRKN